MNTSPLEQFNLITAAAATALRQHP